MKLRLTHRLSQVALTAIVLVVFSIACSASRSATSPAQLANTAPNSQSSSPIVISSAQEKSPCTLNLTDVPVLRGLKLGMTRDEVIALFPGSKDDPEVSAALASPPSRFGTSSLVIRPEKYENKADFADISQITFSLLDGRISSLYVGYTGPAWKHVDEFVTKFIEGTRLPAADQWEAYVGFDTQMKTLTCANFSIRLFAGSGGGSVTYVQMQDLDADKTLKGRRKKAREQASPTPGQ